MKKKIDVACIIDDDEIFVFGAKKIMQLANFCNSIMVFQNGREAFDALKPIILAGENIPEVVLLDLNMPVMDGWEFLDELTTVECPKEMLIYIVTSSIDAADTARAERYSQVSNYMVKPISFEHLQDILEEM